MKTSVTITAVHVHFDPELPKCISTLATHSMDNKELPFLWLPKWWDWTFIQPNLWPGSLKPLIWMLQSTRHSIWYTKKHIFFLQNQPALLCCRLGMQISNLPKCENLRDDHICFALLIIFLMVFSSQHMFKCVAYSESNFSAQASHASGTCLNWFNWSLHFSLPCGMAW